MTTSVPGKGVGATPRLAGGADEEDVPVFQRVLVAIGQREERASVVEFAGTLAQQSGGCVHVLHCMEFAGRGCSAPLETFDEAQFLVEEAVFQLRMHGVGADARVRPACFKPIAALIVDTAATWRADVVVLGARHRRRFRRVLGAGQVGRVLGSSPVPVVVAPLTWDRAHPMVVPAS